jgi:hypothetical protein
MYSIETIRDISRKAAREASRNRRQPLVIEAEDIEDALAGDNAAVKGIPFLGTYCPKGWKRVRLTVDTAGVYEGDNKGYGAYFVDNSGLGADDEPALTFRRFLETIKPGYGYGIVEAGQFQIKVGQFERV